MPDRGLTATWTAEVDGDSPLPLLAAGTVVARRFVIEECLGVGGFAVVYRALDRDLKRLVAVKILKSSRRDPRLVALRREVAVARDVACPHLARVFDFDTDAEIAFLTMELAEGGSLKAELREGPLAVDRVVELATGILVGLEALHAHGIVHRDVKPGNVLLDSSGSAKLADFGLALSLDPDGLTRATTESAIVGTVEYLAPEQFRGLPVDTRTDLYALGVMLFEMLVGHLPHPSGTRLETVIAHLQRSAPDVRALRPEVPPWLAAFVARLLEKEPAHRYGSASEALSRLREHRTGVVRWQWRKHRAVILGAAALLALAAGVATWTYATRPRFSHLIEEGQRGIAAVDGKGKVLWRLPGVEPSVARHATLARIEKGARSALALVPYSFAEMPSRAARTLTFRDPENGELLGEMELDPSRLPFQGIVPRFIPSPLGAADVDGDGVDELFVSFNHMIDAPSFVVMFEPAAHRISVVFQALGHYCPVGVHRLDGEPELLLLGTNNRMGWVNAMAAVRLEIRQGIAGSRETAGMAFPPDLAFDLRYEPTALHWYSLLPPGRVPSHLGFTGRVVEYDDEKKTLSIRYEDGPSQTLRFDGSPLTLSPDQSGSRRAASDAAYRALREGERLRTAGVPEEAAAILASAVAAAGRAQDARLAEVAERWRGRALIQAGRWPEADAALTALFDRAESPSNVAWDAARTFHLAGDLTRAARWYEKGLQFDVGAKSGRQKHYYLLGLVMVLGEAGQWDEARAAVATFLGSSGDPTAGELAKQFVNWRAGWPVDASGLFPMVPNYIDQLKAWHLEIRRAGGLPASALLAELDTALSRADDSKGELLSVRGALLADLGRRDEAIAALQQAIGAFSLDAGTDPAARFDRKLAKERLEKLMKTHPRNPEGPPAR